MKRAIVLFAMLAGCAVQREAKEPPRSTAPVDEDKKSTTSAPPPSIPAGGGGVPSAPTPGTSATGTVVVSPELQNAQANVDAANKAFAAAGNDCAQLCKALSSMDNATEHLCGLTGDDQRCKDARAKLEFARAKVKATCGTC